MTEVDVKVEIPHGGKIKYEWHDGKIICDRKLHTPFAYPFNYGYIQGTLSEDGDEIDAVILTEYPLFPTCHIKCRIIGALLTEDEKGHDEKVLVVPVSSVDPSFEKIKDVTDLEEAKRDEIHFFFSNYKRLEPKKWVKVKDFISAIDAIELYQKGIARRKGVQVEPPAHLYS